MMDLAKKDGEKSFSINHIVQDTTFFILLHEIWVSYDRFMTRGIMSEHCAVWPMADQYWAPLANARLASHHEAGAE